VTRGGDGFFGSIEEEVLTSRSVTDVVRRTVERVLSIAGAGEADMRLLIVEAARGAVEGGAEVDAEPSETAKGIMIGVLQVSTGDEAAEAIGTVARTVRDEARRHGWEDGAVLRGLVAGAVEAAPDAGIAIERAAALVHESIANS